MRNRRVIFSVLTSCVLLGFVLVACEDEKPSEFVDPKLDSGVPDRVVGFQTDGNAQPETGAVVECKPALPGNFAPVFKTPTATKDCSAEDITAYYNACLDPETKRTLASQECKDFRTAKPTCGDCIENKDGAGPIQSFRERLYFLPNNAGCVALVQTQNGGTSQCGEAYNAYEECRRQACDSCFDVKGVQYGDFQDCRELSKASGECQRRGAEFDNQCLKKGYKLADGGAPECFGTGTDFPATRAFFTRLIKITCGQ